MSLGMRLDQVAKGFGYYAPHEAKAAKCEHLTQVHQKRAGPLSLSG